MDGPLQLEEFHQAHSALAELTAALRQAAQDLPLLDGPARRDRLTALREALAEQVLPHMLADERLLYPEIGRRLGLSLATATMSYDHLAIRDWIRRLDDLEPDAVDEGQEILYGLDALIRAHVWKEDEVYLRMLESPSWPT